eukprot:snap_masked-scaffold_6-processed-gene-16.31-mRNA-1 protein AED:1.00 eAED:1.00 QI:0/0/0/0/1/1/2/0/143
MLLEKVIVGFYGVFRVKNNVNGRNSERENYTNGLKRSGPVIYTNKSLQALVLLPERMRQVFCLRSLQSKNKANFQGGSRTRKVHLNSSSSPLGIEETKKICIKFVPTVLKYEYIGYRDYALKKLQLGIVLLWMNYRMNSSQAW